MLAPKKEFLWWHIHLIKLFEVEFSKKYWAFEEKTDQN